MHRPRNRLALVLAVAGGLAGTARAAALPCPAAATMTVSADNQSAAGGVTLSVSGTRLVSSSACDATGTGFATSYATTVPCAGAGTTTCGRIGGLAPGLWVHRVAVSVAGSAPQVQAQQSVLVGHAGTGVSNLVAWTIYGRTFVVDAAIDTNLLSALDAAAAYTTSSNRSALVRFDPVAFPGASAPKTIDVKHAIQQPGDVHVCGPDAVCTDGRRTAYCLEGSRITVDAIDPGGLPGGVVLRVGTCSRSLFRLYGSDVVLRGLVLDGSTNAAPTIPLDTILFGGGARRSRLEQCVIHGPTLGDGVSVQDAAGQPSGGAPAEIVVADSEIAGAEDKGLKADFDGVVRIERTCIHDNRNGGVQATLGGTVAAFENVVQHNIGGPAENGFFVGVPNPGSAPNVLRTRGNIVRFNGARGMSVVNAATATLASDVVTDNYQAGIRVESVVTAEQPSAHVRGSTFACNFAPGVCPDATVCRTDGECGGMPCGPTPAANLAKGVGAALDQCLWPGCLVPLGDFGSSEDAGRNALTRNANPSAAAPGGANLTLALADLVTVAAAGNQWEHCAAPQVDPTDATRCYLDQVAALDVRPSGSDVDLGSPPSPRHVPPPVLTAVSPGRPRAGDFVRLYGDAFDAIDGTVCAPPGLPADPCSGENEAAVVHNATASDGTRVTVTIGSPPVTVDAEVHAITPAMVVFKMPVDCFAPASLVVRRGTVVSAPIALCDPGGCVGRQSGDPCDDLDDVCTLGEACTADGACTGTSLDCDDGDPCTTDGCDPVAGCTHVARPDGTVCGTPDACHGPPTCQATACVPGPPASCNDSDACTDDTCDLAAGCRNVARVGMDAVRCRFARMRELIGEVPSSSRRLMKKLLARLACGESQAARADAAPGDHARRRRARRALGCVARYDALLARDRTLTPALRGELRGEGTRARDAIEGAFGLG